MVKIFTRVNVLASLPEAASFCVCGVLLISRRGVLELVGGVPQLRCPLRVDDA